MAVGVGRRRESGTGLAEGGSDAGRRETLKTLQRALRLMDALAEADQGLGLVELSRKLAMNKAVVYRILLTLGQAGYVVQDPRTDRYSLSLKVFELGSAVVNRTGLAKAALGPMTELSRCCCETVNLAILDGKEAVYIDRVECAEALRAVRGVGTRVPVHCSALGKALIAYLPPQQQEALLSSITLKQFTQQTIMEMDRLRAELRRVREVGFALDDEEHIPGVRCLGAPVFNHRGEVVAAVSIAGPSVRLTRERILGFADALKSTAAAVSRNLGYTGR